MGARLNGIQEVTGSIPVRSTISRLTFMTARIAVLVALLLSLTKGATAQSPEWFGTWHMNVQKSTFGPGGAPYARGKWVVSQLPSGEVTMVYDLVGARGGVTHMEWTGRLDGRDYRMQGPDAVVHYAYTVVDAKTLGLIVKVDGRITAAARVVLGPDGVVTATSDARTSRGVATTVTVYEKR